jgi:hypothetical protein
MGYYDQKIIWELALTPELRGRLQLADVDKERMERVGTHYGPVIVWPASSERATSITGELHAVISYLTIVTDETMALAIIGDATRHNLIKQA